MSPPGASRKERNLLAALRDPAQGRDRLRTRLGKLRADETFVLNDAWGGLALDASLEPWRRVEAARILVERCVGYPSTLDAFETAVLRPLGVDRGGAVDMTMAQVLPIERRHGEVIQMVPLPIDTGVGAAAVYYAMARGTRDVLRAGVSPGPRDLDESARG